MSRIDRRRPGRYAGDRPVERADSPIDAPYGRSRSATPAAGVVGQVNPGEIIAARTAAALLTTALGRRGLHAESGGSAMLAIRRPGAGGRVTVMLGHHPHDSGRLWWWLVTPDPAGRSPDGAWRSCLPARHALGPVDEAADVARRIAWMLPG